MPPITRNNKDDLLPGERSPDRVKRTRNRIPQSCQTCRRRKLKCDRQHPACQNCVKRGDEAGCIYVEPPEDDRTRGLRARLEQLEAQVRQISSSLVAAESMDEDPVEEPDLEHLVQQFAKLRVWSKDDNTVFYGPNSRFSIMAEYPEIIKLAKSQRKEKHGDCDQAIRTHRECPWSDPFPTGFPFGYGSGATIADLQASLPDRNICERLLVRYFECSNSLFAIVDPDLMNWEQYSTLWSTTTPPSLSLLAIGFFIIAIAAQSLNAGHDLLAEITPDGPAGALKLSKMWKAYGQMALSQNHLLKRSSLRNIQAMLLLCLLEDGDHARWNLLGMLGNMARIAGLHRDPNVFSEQIDEKGRMVRRRLWIYIYVLVQIDATHYGYPPNIAEGTFDCEALEMLPSNIPDPDNTFLYWLFKLHGTISASFPGPLGIHKTLSAVEKTDAVIKELLAQLPPHLSIPDDYNPAVESPLEIIRRYTLVCMIHGHLLTLHRPYATMSENSKKAAVTAAWTLVEYQKQLIALSDKLEPFAWYIEEFLDPHLFRATAFLGVLLSRNPQDPLADTIVQQVEICENAAVAKSFRKRDFYKTSCLFRAIYQKLTEKTEDTPAGLSVPLALDVSQEESLEERGFGMEEVLSESVFRWDDYLIDMVLNTDQDTM